MRDINSVLKLRKECKRAAELIDIYESLAMRMTAQLSDMPRSGSPTPIDDWWAKLADQRDYYNKKVTEYVQATFELNTALDKLPDENIRLAMKARYISGEMVADIAEQMHYSERNLYRMLKAGRKQYNELPLGEE